MNDGNQDQIPPESWITHFRDWSEPVAPGES